ILNPVTSFSQYLQGLGSRIKGLTIDKNNPQKVTVELNEASIQNPHMLNGVPIIDKRFFDPEGVLDGYSLEVLLQNSPELQSDSTLITWGEIMNHSDNSLKPENLRGVTGPYQIVEWAAKDYVKLSRNPNYWAAGRKGSLYSQGAKQIIYRFQRQPESLKLQTKQGVYDALSYVPYKVWESLKENSAVTQEYDFLSGNRNSHLFLGFNCRPDGIKHKKIFDDWRVRRAVAHLISIEEYNKEWYGGFGKPITTPVPVGSDDYHTGLQPRVRSRDSAEYWLDQAGWKDNDGDLIREKMIEGKMVPLQATLSIATGRESQEAFSGKLVSEARAVGMDITTEQLAMSKLGQKYQSKTHDYDMLVLGLNYGIAPYEFNQQWTTEALFQNSNFAGYTNPVIDSLNNLSLKTFDLEERRPIIKKMQEVWFRDQPNIMLIQLPAFSLTHKRYGRKSLSKAQPYLWLNTLVPTE
ncbi:MAG: ABC transporter substrate-binding protein, partial [Bacteroidia bacterium]